MSDISVNIGQVVVDGVTGRLRNGERLGQMMGAALHHLLAQRGLPDRLIERAVVELGGLHINLSTNASEEQAANEIAGALYRALGRTR